MTGCLETVLHVRRVDRTEGFIVTKRERQRILADHPDARELDRHAALAFMAGCSANDSSVSAWALIKDATANPFSYSATLSTALY